VSNSNEVLVAVMAALAADAALLALMPGGVFFGMSQGPATQFVVVTLETHEDSYQFGGPAFERFVLRVAAVEQAAADLNGDAAQARIYELLQDVLLTIAGYDHTLTRRVGFVREIQLDDVDRANRWQHRGGRYEVIVTPAPEVARQVPDDQVFSETE
jgi:hypothetical protein